jgi:hypothetical protein
MPGPVARFDPIILCRHARRQGSLRGTNWYFPGRRPGRVQIGCCITATPKNAHSSTHAANRRTQNDTHPFGRRLQKGGDRSDDAAWVRDAGFGRSFDSEATDCAKSSTPRGSRRNEQHANRDVAGDEVPAGSSNSDTQLGAPLTPAEATSNPNFLRTATCHHRAIVGVDGIVPTCSAPWVRLAPGVETTTNFPTTTRGSDERASQLACRCRSVPRQTEGC